MSALVAEIPEMILGAAVGVISGSGLSVVPNGVEVVDGVPYERLGWPVTGVTGHPSRLLIGRWCAARGTATGDGAVVLLACGRPHLYEGWSPSELRRQVDDLAGWGVSRLVLTNAAGSLKDDAPLGSAVVADEVIDLQRAPGVGHLPQQLRATAPALAEPARRALEGVMPVRRGRYVSVAGPQYETAAEAAWLATVGDAVGMSAAPEVRAALDHHMQSCVVSLVVNSSGASVGHDEVVAAGAGLAAGLRAALAALLQACWPSLFPGPSVGV